MEITPPNAVSVRDPQTSEPIGRTATENVLYRYHSCSTGKFTKPIPCTGKYESIQEGTTTGDNCWEIIVLSAYSFLPVCL